MQMDSMQEPSGTVLDRKGYEHVDIIAPILETLPVTADDPELLMKALVCGDILYSADPHMRDPVLPLSASRWQPP